MVSLKVQKKNAKNAFVPTKRLQKFSASAPALYYKRARVESVLQRTNLMDDNLAVSF